MAKADLGEDGYCTRCGWSRDLVMTRGTYPCPGQRVKPPPPDGPPFSDPIVFSWSGYDHDRVKLIEYRS